MSNLRFALLPLLIVACSSDNTAKDAGADASKDATTFDASKDATTLPDVTSDVKLDVAADVAADVTGDVKSDAPTDAPSDVVSDAPSDAPADGPTDAALDAGSSWHTPTCDGTIASGEYGSSQNQTTSNTQTWYMTWDSTNLYVALDNATLTEANVLYIGFGTGNGMTTGQTYDGTNGSLPFAADAVLYAKTGYQEVRTANADAGMWSGAVSNVVTFCSSGSTREEVIPWTALGQSGLPANFRFLAYATSSTGFVYGQIPTTNPGGNIGTSATFGHDFYVSSTSNGTGSFPFAVTE